MITQPVIRAAGTASSVVGGVGFRWLKPAMETAALASGHWPLTPDPAPGQWTCFPRVAIRTPGTDAKAVPAARDFATATLRRWGVAERCNDVAVVVTELLTNALAHALPTPGPAQAGRAVQLGLLQPGPCVLCIVADPSQQPPVLKHPGALAETGRGLYLVTAFSDGWGHAPLGDLGKAVWAMFSTAPRPACTGPGGPG
jgi:Histidine kinase-like ATPase domain